MMVKACAVGLVCSVCVLLLREFGWRGAPVFAAVSALSIISFVLPEIKGVVGEISGVISSVGASEVAASVLKIVGVGYISGVCADVCRDIGAERIGSAVTLVGKIEIAVISLPHVVNMLRLGLELMG